jgi:hypothetical protein
MINRYLRTSLHGCIHGYALEEHLFLGKSSDLYFLQLFEKPYEYKLVVSVFAYSALDHDISLAKEWLTDRNNGSDNCTEEVEGYA